MSPPYNQRPLRNALPAWLRLSLALIIVAASLARLLHLERMVVWHDEVYTAVRVLGFDQGEMGPTVFSGRLLSPADLLGFQKAAPEHTWIDTLHALAQHPEHSPLYYMAGFLATQWVSPPILALRGTSALFSLLLAPAVFWLMRELFGRGKAPWVAAALVAVSPFHLLYAQEARQYALWTVLIAAAGAALLKALRTGRRWDWGLYAGMMTIGMYSHMLFLLMVPLHGFYALLDCRESRPGRGSVVRPWLTATGVAVLLFLPWLSLAAVRSELVQRYTAWMARSVETLQLLEAWGQHLTHLFVDPATVLSRWWLLVLLPLFWALIRFCTRAPRPARWFPCLLIAIAVVTVLGPDLLTGGSRSLHARYTLPALLGVELAVAWVLAAAWERPSARRQTGAILVLALLLVLGGWSDMRILHADTSWTKNFSAENAAIARLINAGDRPLVVASDQGVSAGELVSLAYGLRAGVALWGEPYEGNYDLPSGFGDLFVLTPSSGLRERIERTHRLAPLLGAWQWYRAEPKASHEPQVAPQQPFSAQSDTMRAPRPGHSP